MSPNREFVIIVVTLALCVVYVSFVIKTQKIDKKRKAIILLIGLLIESSLIYGVNEILSSVFPPITSPENAITYATESTSNSGDTKIDVTNNNYNNNSTYYYNSSASINENLEANENSTAKKNTTCSTTATTTSKPTVSLSFEKIEYPLTDNNGDFRAYTSFEATKVTLYCEANGVVYGEFDMKTSDLQNWTFDACFYESNTYVFTAIAEGPLGEVRSTPVTVLYPF